MEQTGSFSIDGPVNIQVMLGLTLPSISDEELASIEQAAPVIFFESFDLVAYCSLRNRQLICRFFETQMASGGFECSKLFQVWQSPVHGASL